MDRRWYAQYFVKLVNGPLESMQRQAKHFFSSFHRQIKFPYLKAPINNYDFDEMIYMTIPCLGAFIVGFWMNSFWLFWIFLTETVQTETKIGIIKKDVLNYSFEISYFHCFFWQCLSELFFVRYNSFPVFLKALPIIWLSSIDIWICTIDESSI